jgi:hypothetical protein
MQPNVAIGGVRRRTVTPVYHDRYIDKVAAGLHLDGTNGSTTFTDITGKSWTATGNAQIDTSQSKFGGASLKCDGTGDSITTGNSSDFDFGSGNFTIALWFRLNSNAAPGILVGKRATSANYCPFLMFTNTSGVLTCRASTDGSSWGYAYDSPNSTITTGVWYYLAFVRFGTTFAVILDGVVKNSATLSGALYTNTTALYVGAEGDASLSHNGWIDDLWITKGVARYSAAFPIPASSFLDS